MKETEIIRMKYKRQCREDFGEMNGKETLIEVYWKTERLGRSEDIEEEREREENFNSRSNLYDSPSVSPVTLSSVEWSHSASYHLPPFSVWTCPCQRFALQPSLYLGLSAVFLAALFQMPHWSSLMRSWKDKDSEYHEVPMDLRLHWLRREWQRVRRGVTEKERTRSDWAKSHWLRRGSVGYFSLESVMQSKGRLNSFPSGLRVGWCPSHLLTSSLSTSLPFPSIQEAAWQRSSFDSIGSRTTYIASAMLPSPDPSIPVLWIQRIRVFRYRFPIDSMRNVIYFMNHPIHQREEYRRSCQLRKGKKG